MKILFLGHRGIGVACLKALAADRRFSIVGVVIHSPAAHPEAASDAAAFTDLCAGAGLPLRRHDEARAVGEALAATDAEIGVCVGFMTLLPPEVFGAPKWGILNLHAGRLPRYRGRAPISWALINGEREIGITVHRMNAGIDSGDIVAQECLPASPEDTAATLYEQVRERSPALLIRALLEVRDHDFRNAVAQNEAEAIAYPNLPPEMGAIDWSRPRRRIHDQVRALVPPYPGAYTLWKGARVPVHGTRLEPCPEHVGLPGHILAVEGTEWIVQAGDGRLRITRLVLPADPAFPRPRRGDIFGM
jgi:methionyl-tRNA formyltransferase